MSHTCHWTGCQREVPPAMWGCTAHWWMLPKYLRDAIWKWYVHGQEVRKDPSEQYLDAAHVVQEWIAKCGNGYPITKRGVEGIHERKAIDDEFRAALPKWAK